MATPSEPLPEASSVPAGLKATPQTNRVPFQYRR
jgi:hypothetical protein